MQKIRIEKTSCYVREVRSTRSKSKRDRSKTLSSLRDQLATLEQDLSFYKNVITKQTDDTGLMVSEWSLKRISNSNRYRYKLALRQQDADGDTYLNGHVNVNLVGTQNGKILFTH